MNTKIFKNNQLIFYIKIYSMRDSSISEAIEAMLTRGVRESQGYFKNLLKDAIHLQGICLQAMILTNPGQRNRKCASFINF